LLLRHAAVFLFLSLSGLKEVEEEEEGRRTGCCGLEEEEEENEEVKKEAGFFRFLFSTSLSLITLLHQSSSLSLGSRSRAPSTSPRAELERFRNSPPPSPCWRPEEGELWRRREERANVKVEKRKTKR
jgi:hypothetical protein